MRVQSTAVFSMERKKKQHSCHGNGSGIKGPADLGLRPQSSLLGAGRDKAQGTDHVQKLCDQPREGTWASSHTCTSFSLLLFTLNGACMK